MAQENIFAKLSLEDINVNEEGQITITNQEITEQLKAALQNRKETSKTGTNGCPTNLASGGCQVVIKA